MKLKKYSVILAVLLLAILAIGAVSAESIDDTDVSTDSIDDVSVDITDNDVKNSLSAVALEEGEETSYDIDDNSYSTYFNENGTATDKLDPMGNYTLNIGNITNKDIKIDSGSSINLIAKDNGGFITNGTLTIGDGAGSAGSIFISGLTFTNVDKDAIVVNDLSTDITIDDNTFDLTYTSTYAGSPMAIVTYGYVDDVEITANEITMVSSAGYTYGIDLSYYLAGWTSYASSNAEHFYIADNIIDITSDAVGGMAEAMYLDTIANSVIENNIIEVTTSAAGTANYAMQVADSWGFYNDPFAASAYNITINNNHIDLDSADMAYGITVISLWPYDEEFETIVKDIQILENAIVIESQTGAIGIGVKTSDVLVDGNTIIISANETAPVSCYPDPAFGNESAAIYVANFDPMMGYYINNAVVNNFINVNVRAVKVNSTESGVKPLIIENNTFFIDDGTYAIYFNEDGTATDELSADGDYTLVIDEITNKDMIIDSGSNINIIASDECLITNGTLTIGDGAGSAASILIAGLNFVNVDKDAIVVNDLSTDITIDDNTFDLTYTSTYAGSPMAIVTYGYVDDVEITDNDITMVSSAFYTYGIDLSYYLAGWTSYASSNAEHFYIADNTIDITSDAAGGMAEAMYLDTIANSVIENNIIKVTTSAAGTANYAMQVADSWGFLNDPFAASAYNITINNNHIDLDSADMVYGITVISLYPYDEDFETIVKDIQILENVITIESQTGAIGIGVKTSDALVDDNIIIISANETAPVSCYPDPAFGNESAAIYVANFDSMMGYYTNDTVTNNFVIANVQEGVKVNSTGADVEPLVVENNTVFLLYVINEETYDLYFTNEGTTGLLDGGETLYFGNLTDKNILIDIPLTIKALDEESKLVNSTIKIISGAEGTIIDGLSMEFTGDNTTGSVGIIYVLGVSDVSILNNEILVPDFVDKAGAKYGSSLYAIEVESGAAGANNIIIDGNYINVTGSSRYLYGIDVFKTWGSENANSYITITNNDIWIDPASRMSEGIYASDIANALISGNFIYSESDAAAYGIGTDSLTDSAITDNEIYAVAMTQAYGITSTNSKNVEITDNEIESTGEGAIGIGTNSEFVTIDDNDIVITGGDYTSITSSDTLGTANAAILDKGTNNTIGDNDVEEDIPVTINDDNYADYFDENGYLKNDSGILDGDIVFFDTLSNKNMKITERLTIKGAPGNKLVNTTFTLLYEASGSTVANLNIEFTGDNTTGSVGIIYAFAASDIEISGNNITVLDFVDNAGSKWGSSLYAIEIESGEAGSSFVLIKDNNIDIKGSSRYLYGIDVFKTWGSENGNSQFFITNNFVSVDGASRMSEGIYASDIEEAYIEENTILSSGTTAAYGIGTDSLTNSTILDNVIGVIAGTQAYAITNTFSENVDISENHINASGVGAIGIGTNSEKVTIEDNEIEITGGDYTSITSSDTLGTGNAAIFLKTDDATLDNNTVTENMPIIVDDFTYLRYFNEDGTINEDAIKAGDTVFIGELADKIMTFDVAVEIAPANTSKLTDSLINIVAGADGTYIHGLDIEFTGDAYTGSVGLIYLKSVSNVIVSDNAIVVPDFVNKEGSKYGSSLYAIEVESGVDGCDNILISANYIEINGTANYLYGIDVFKTWGGEKNNTQISINSNDIIINGGAKMAEAIYVSESNDVEVIDNEIYCLAQAAGYGIGTDRLTESLISGNIIEIEAETTAYGITATVSGSDAVIEGNDVTIEGISAVGIGLSCQENATVANNTVDVLGGDYSAVTSSDSLGTAIAAILDKDNSNTNLVVEGNNLTENYLEVNTTHNGNSSKELQALIDAAEAGSVLDLQDVIYAGISNVVIDKDLTIANGTFIGKAGETVFIIPANGPSEVNFTDNIFGINNANTLVLATATNGTSPTAIDTPTINIVNNEFVLKEGAVGESATILELDSERSSLAPSGQLSVVNNTIDAGINPFEFKVTSFENEGNAEVPAGGNIPEKVETVILLENMTTFAYQSSVDGDIGDYFYATLQDVNGNPLANKTVKVGLNGNIYTRTTNETGGIGVLMKTAISGRYTFAVSFLGDDNYNASFAVALCTVNKQTPKLSTSSKTYKASAKTKTLSATFKTKAGHALKGKTIKFTVNGKTYSATTNSNGVASVKVSLSKKGTYSFTAKYAGDSTYASVSKKATLKLT